MGNIRLDSMDGYFGKILKVGLSDGSIGTLEPEPALYRDYLGGSGLAARLFFDMGGYLAHPLGPDNPLFIMNGPLSGTTLPGSSRLEVCALSPLTWIWGESSMGGHVSPRLRASGYDGVIVTGASYKPVYLLVTDDGVEIRDASHLWGKDTFETEQLLAEEIGGKKTGVMSIGPAGENLVKYAAIVNDRGSLAGRTGMGAVMGSKKLKALVFTGNAKTRIADREAYKEVRARAQMEIRTSVAAEGFQAYGSNLHMEMGMAISDVPVKNWREALWEEGMAALSGVTVAQTIMTRTHSCYACPIACKRIVRIDQGAFTMKEGPGLEYEGASALGTLQRCDNLEAVSKANELADRYGMDCISAGSTIAYATEAFEEGIITKEDTGGIELEWNQPELLVRLIGMIARREGFGDDLAEGSRAMAEKYGGRELAIHVKGLEVPMHDPRALWGMSLTYATGVRGACHVNDDNLTAELGNISFREVGGTDTRPYRAEGKAEQTVFAQRYGMLAGSAVICLYAWWSMDGIEILRDMLNAVTGAGYSSRELMEVGDRIWYMKRSIGNLCGITSEDDVVPERLLRPHLEGEASDYIRILYPMISAMSRRKIYNERMVSLLKKFSRDILAPRLFKTINGIGRVVSRLRRDTPATRSVNREDENRVVEFKSMMDDYYRIRQFDERGVPVRSRLSGLGLSDVADVLERLEPD